jgi:bla regulator protein blaR1
MMLQILIRASLEGTVLAVLVWSAIKLFPRLSAGVRTILWWCVAARFVLAVAWPVPIQLPVLPLNAPPATTMFAPAPRVTVNPSADQTVESVPMPAQPNAPARTWWSAALLAAWALGVAIVLVIDVRRWRRTAALVRRSAAAPVSTALAAEIAASLRLRRVPAVHLSHEIGTPLVTGIVRPRVLLPARSAVEFPHRQQRMVLCHELAHVKRADLWMGLVPALAERLFFFHPLVRFAAREYALCREAACDAAVLDTLGADAQEYGRLLLDLGVSRHPLGLAAAGASPSFSSLKRRIIMLSSVGSRLSRRTAIAIAALAVLIIVPLRLTARPEAAPARGSAPATPHQLPAELKPWFGNLHPRMDRLRNELRPMAEWLGRQQPRPRFTYVLILEDDHIQMSGSRRDIDRAKQLRRGAERLLWFERDGAEYVLRDPRLIEQAVALWKPVSDLGDAQGELGTRQGMLGTRQGELGTKQGELGTQQGRLGTEQGVMASRQAAMELRRQALAGRERSSSTAAEERALAVERRKFEQDRRAIEREMGELDVKMRELDAPMRDLGRQMEVLGKEMEALGRKMEDAARRAEGEMEALIERAIATGAAELVR